MPWLLVLALFAVAAFPLFALPVNFDVSWLFYMAGRMLDGVELYRGVVEPNPPLIVWLNLPVHILAAASGVSGAVLLRLGALAMVALSIGVTYGVLSRHEVDEKPAVFAVVLAFALLSVADHHVLQREHIFLALGMPYAGLAAARLRGRRVGLGPSIAVGALAAIGFWLKPFYLAVWLAVEVLVATRRGWRSALHPANVTVAALGAAYVAAIPVVAPAYLQIARWGASVYRSYGPPMTALDILLDPRAVAAAFLIGFSGAFWRRYPVSELRLVLLTVLGAYLAAVLAQGKSFPNHWYPAEAMLVLAGYATLADVGRARSSPGRLRLRRLAAAAAIALLAVAGLNAKTTAARWRAAYQQEPFFLDDMTAFLHEGEAASSFFMLGGTMRSSFPLTLVSGVPYVSRFHSLWLLAGSYETDCHDPCRPFPYHPPSEMAPPERYQFDAVIEDLRATHPDVVFVDLVAPQRMAGFDYGEYFEQSQAFRDVFASYRYVETVGGRYRAYRRVR